MFTLSIHDDARADLENLWDHEPEAAAKITALLEELDGNQDLLDHLTDHGYGEDGSTNFSISKWLRFWNRGKDLWRLKLWNLERSGLAYRVIYAFTPGELHYHVLAVAPRAFDYDSKHPLTQRILKTYEDL